MMREGGGKERGKKGKGKGLQKKEWEGVK